MCLHENHSSELISFLMFCKMCSTEGMCWFLKFKGFSCLWLNICFLFPRNKTLYFQHKIYIVRTWWGYLQCSHYLQQWIKAIWDSILFSYLHIFYSVISFCLKGGDCCLCSRTYKWMSYIRLLQVLPHAKHLSRSSIFFNLKCLHCLKVDIPYALREDYILESCQCSSDHSEGCLVHNVDDAKSSVCLLCGCG